MVALAEETKGGRGIYRVYTPYNAAIVPIPMHHRLELPEIDTRVTTELRQKWLQEEALKRAKSRAEENRWEDRLRQLEKRGQERDAA